MPLWSLRTGSDHLHIVKGSVSQGLESTYILVEHLGEIRRGLRGCSDGKDSACSTRNLGLISGLGSSPGEVSGYPLQYSCLENSMDRGASWAIVHGVVKSGTQLSN